MTHLVLTKTTEQINILGFFFNYGSKRTAGLNSYLPLCNFSWDFLKQVGIRGAGIRFSLLAL